MTNHVGLLAVLANSLVNVGQVRTRTQLGDRSSYIGLSDIGKGAECLRSVVASKIFPITPVERHDRHSDERAVLKTLRKQLILQRGHWQEFGIEAALRVSNYRVISQLEIRVAYKGVPIQAHLDLTLVVGGTKPAVRILELKCNEKLPSTLYFSNEVQLSGQVGLLHACWSKPCFALRDVDGNLLYQNLTFPDMVQKMFGITLPDRDQVSIEGWVTSLAFSDAKAFGPYRPSDGMTRFVLNTGLQIWESVQGVCDGKININDLEYAHGCYPLCDYCEHNADCPKFSAALMSDDPELEQQLDELGSMKAEVKELEARIKSRERELKELYKRSGSITGVRAGSWCFRDAPVAGRTILDQEKLRNELARRIGTEDTDMLWAKCTTAGNGHSRLAITKIKNA